MSDELTEVAYMAWRIAIRADGCSNRQAVQAALTAALASMEQPELTDVERKALEGVMTNAEYEAGYVDDIAPSIDDDEDAYWAYHTYHGIKKFLLPAPPAAVGGG